MRAARAHYEEPLQLSLGVRRHPKLVQWPGMMRRPRSYLALLLMGGVACAAQRGRAREITFANATRATVTAADSGASVICVASIYTREPLRDVRVATPATGAEARTAPDGCATLSQRATQASISVGRLGFTRRIVPVTVRRGYADTVSVLLRRATPSDQECRQARRDGQGCL